MTLSDALARFLGVTHWAISMRVAGKGDFISRLQNGSDCSTKVKDRVMDAFSRTWPEDLEWPSDIPRPEQVTPAAGASDA